MKSMSIVLTLCALLLAAACAGENDPSMAATEATPATTASQLTPEELGELGAHIEKEPANAENLLSAKGLNEDSFEEAIRKVSEDPEAAKRYAEAYKRARA